MKGLRKKRFALLTSLALLVALCAPPILGQTNRPHGRIHRRSRKRQAATPRRVTITGYQSLVNKLHAEGVRVERTSEEASQPFFTVTGRVVKVNGEGVQVFEYPSATAAEKEAKQVSPSGSPVGTSMIAWIAPPHFYRSGRIIALYIGSNQIVTRALTAALGPQFAGK